MARVLASLLLFVTACGARTGLHTPDAGPRDAAVIDGFVPIDVGLDSGHDAGPPDCTTSAECDDRAPCTDERCVDQHCVREPHHERCDDDLFCNGVETCAPFAGCTPGAPPVCADPIACTLDRCDEDEDACVFEPDVSLCPISHRCDETRGCVARILAHDPGFLMEVDVPEGTVHRLGMLPVGLTDVALATDGTLYGAVPGALYRVDYEAARADHVVDVPGRFVALDVGPDGFFYGASDTRVYRIDVAAGTRTEVARFPGVFESSGDVAFVDGALVATANRSFDEDDVLVRIYLDGRASEIIGPIRHPCVWGLAPFGSILYGLTCRGDLLRIDPTSGAATVLAHPGAEFYGAAAR